MRLLYMLKDIGIGLRRNLTMTVALVVVSTISLTLLGVGLLLQRQVELTKGYWYDRVEISVFLCNAYDTGAGCATGAVTGAQRDAVRGALEASPDVATVYAESQQEAYARFQERFDADLARNIAPDQLQESFRVKLVDPQSYEGLVSSVSALPGVYEVSDQRSTLGPIFDIINRLQWTTWAASIALLVAAALLTYILIRIAAFNRRRETSIMRLVGATRTYIQAPFVLEAVLASLAGALLAWGLLAAFKVFVVDDQLATHLRFTAWIGWDAVRYAAGWVLGTGIVLATLSSLVSLRRYLRV